MKTKAIRTHEGGHYGVRFHCPGCGEEHGIPTTPHPKGWEFNGDHERPTLSPSILIYEVRIPADADPAKVVAPYKPGDVFSPRCHSFVRDGRIQFLSDSGHALAGQTVDLPELKEEVTMGQWNISIHGMGVHHNADRLPEDANRMAADFVKQLRAKGHTVTKATITYGGEEDVTDADAYAANYAPKPDAPK